ncbi:calcineurin-like phosphoesterase C-terminal domain-containing protein [Flavisolibacter sp. BT320]|nr:calcineurin-like phosphoesterase C-terminal domain-containing protein [Flavisolibacter longurius]
MKIFFRYIFLLLCFFSPEGYSAAQANGNEPVLLQGRVTDEKGRGLPGVAVTDGTSIVRTNRKGAYRFYTTGEAPLVYLTLPSGYEIPSEAGIAKFYQPIKAVKGKFTADFKLKKLDRPDTKHFAIVWADPQINTDAQAQQLIAVSAPDTKEHVQELLQQGPVHGITAGDIYWDNFAMIPPYKKAVEVTGVPFFQVLGNHDMDINVRSDEASDNTFHEHFGPSWYSFNRGNAHYVVLDNVFYYANGYNYIGYITEQQLKWLEQDLAGVRPGSPVFVSMHISAYNHEKRRNKKAADNPGNITFNRQALYNLLKPFKAHLLTGHSHTNENLEEGSVYEHNTAALCGAWWTSPICTDGTPAGYGVYEVDGNNVSWYYKSVGRDKSHQMRVYNRGRYAARPADIAVNVWNWDRTWKVEWKEDGKAMGAMKQETALDADAIAAMAGADKLGTYAWIEPSLTDHLFFATPSPAAKTVAIIVTDRFGNTYTETIELK